MREKALRTHFLARMIGCVGHISCVLGCIVYLILCMPEVADLPFEWVYVAIVAAATVLFVLVDMIFHTLAAGYEKKAEQEEKHPENAGNDTDTEEPANV